MSTLRRPSFRLRVAVGTVLTAGCVMVGFSLAATALLRHYGLQALDRDLRERLLPQLAGRRGPNHWQQLEGAFDLVYPGGDEPGYLMAALGPGGRVLARSAGWPEEVALDIWPQPSGPRRDDRGRDEPFRRRGDRGPMGPDGPPFGPNPPMPAGPPPAVYRTVSIDGVAWRFAAVTGPDATLVLGVDTRRPMAATKRVERSLLVALPAALLLIAAGSWLVSQQALRSVRRLSAAAEQVSAASLDRRIPAEGAEIEFERLISLFNAMLDRLQQSFDQARRFSADAAHELNTPLTVLLGELSEAVQSAEPDSPEQRRANLLLEEVQRLRGIVRKLLLLSQADAGRLPLALETIDLSELVAEAAEDAQALAPGLEVTAEVAAGALVLGDRELLAQCLGNLVTNAVKYNRDGGRIRLALRRDDRLAELTVANTGDGIPAADRQRVFERFYRADPARGRQVDGVGLGMSIAREIARAHGGELRLEASRDDWTSFQLTLPVAAAR